MIVTLRPGTVKTNNPDSIITNPRQAANGKCSPTIRTSSSPAVKQEQAATADHQKGRDHPAPSGFLSGKEKSQDTTSKDRGTSQPDDSANGNSGLIDGIEKK